MRSPTGTFVKTEVWAEVVGKVRPSWGPGGGKQTGMGGEEGLGVEGGQAEPPVLKQGAEGEDAGG